MISLAPIGYVHSSRRATTDDDWDQETATIELNDTFDAAALDGIEDFSHAEIIYHLDRVPLSAIESGTRHPRGNAAWPRVGIFAQRGRARPNRLGLTIVAITGRAGRVLSVRGLDAIDGTPVLDIKPVMVEFLPRSPVRQPSWSTELMRHYWRSSGGPA
jgi:tRNA-Thr(GGU) m(6)t(6)A37 methyltransferase TsaA